MWPRGTALLTLIIKSRIGFSFTVVFCTLLSSLESTVLSTWTVRSFRLAEKPLIHTFAINFLICLDQLDYWKKLLVPIWWTLTTIYVLNSWSESFDSDYLSSTCDSITSIAKFFYKISSFEVRKWIDYLFLNYFKC